MAKSTQPGKVSSSQMKEAWKLFNSGDVVAARREARKLLADSPSTVDAEQAKDLIERTKVPRFAWYLAIAAAALILAMVMVGVAHH